MVFTVAIDDSLVNKSMRKHLFNNHSGTGKLVIEIGLCISLLWEMVSLICQLEERLDLTLQFLSKFQFLSSFKNTLQ